MEEEARIILRDAVTDRLAGPRNLATFTRQCFAPLGGVELELPPRGSMREPPGFLLSGLMFVIDTNVASELMRSEPMATVAAWIGERDAHDMYLTAVSEAELLYGVAIMPVGQRRNALEAAMTRWLDLGFRERIFPFDSAAARAYAEIAAGRRRAGRPIGEADCQIAAIARSRGAVLVTRNVRDFEGTGTGCD